MTLDELRAAHPHLGFALYAYEPGAPVTLEVHAAGEVFTFKGWTAEDAIEVAFPRTESVQPAPPAPPLTEEVLGDDEDADIFEDDTPDIFE